MKRDRLITTAILWPNRSEIRMRRLGPRRRILRSPHQENSSKWFWKKINWTESSSCKWQVRRILMRPRIRKICFHLSAYLIVRILWILVTVLNAKTKNSIDEGTRVVPRSLVSLQGWAPSLNLRMPSWTWEWLKSRKGHLKEDLFAGVWLRTKISTK